MRKIVKKSFHDIKVNDILAEDVVNENGVLLACRGTIVTSSIMALLLSQSDRTYSVLVDYKATSKKARRHEREEKKYEKLIDKAEQAEKLVLSKVVKERIEVKANFAPCPSVAVFQYYKLYLSGVFSLCFVYVKVLISRSLEL